jgi:ADP-heptose:LPS heptosyltransferase
MTEIQHILFVELLGGIGDVVIALPAIHALARSHPDAELTVLTFAPGSELLQTDPLIQQVIVADRAKPITGLERLLVERSFDLIVSDTSYDRIPELIQSSSAKYTVTNLWRSPPSDERVGDRFLKILQSQKLISIEASQTKEIGIHLMTHEQNNARQQLGATLRPLIVLIPDAGMTIKKWATQNFIELGQRLVQHHQATLFVVEGSDLEGAITIAEGIQKNTQVVPKQGLRQMAALLAQADLAIAADTGLARIAAALNVPTITLFGPSWYGRYGQPAPHVNLQGFPTCPERLIHNFTEQSCWYSGHCPYEWRSCLDDITPDQVFDAATNVLQQKSCHSSAGESLMPTLPHPATAAIAHPDWSAVRNVLVMRLDNIGDVMMTSPVFQSLKENLPDAKITLMASPAGSLAAPLIPGIDEVLPWRVLWQDLGRLDFNPEREWELVETLRQCQFDAAIILTSFAQSPHPAALICALADIPLRLGESKERDFSLTHAVPPAPDDIHQVDRNLRLLEFVGLQVSDRRLSLHISPLTHTMPQPYFLLNPWTSCQSRNYAPDRFAEATRRLSEITGWSVVVTGVEKDRDRATPVLDQLGNRAIDLIGQTTLAELVALVAHAKLVLTNNTSTMHIADATNTPNVVMFAGTELECQWQPRFSPSRLLRRPTVCSPCYVFTCPYQLECLDIPVETVVETALALLQDCGIEVKQSNPVGVL